MPIHADFENKYRFAPDPWNASGISMVEYYQALLHFIKRVNPQKIYHGLALGGREDALTRQLRDVCERISGVDISSTTVQRVSKKHTKSDFFAADLHHLETLPFAGATFDLIVLSQALYYFTWDESSMILEQVERLLKSDGIVVLASNCSGPDYYTPQEFRILAVDHFDLLDMEEFKHHLFLAARRMPLEVVITVDYEIFEHQEKIKPDSYLWQTQVLIPCDQLMNVCEEFGAKLTVMFEVGQYRFVEKYLPHVADQIRAQLVDVIRRGHDVQAHVHTRWLPELGARMTSTSNEIEFAMNQARLHDLSDSHCHALLRETKAFLEELLTPVMPNYRTNAFRAGKYQIQPHHQIFKALAAAGYKADSSVWHGGFLSIYDRQPGYDFRGLWNVSKPYWPSEYNICDPCLTSTNGIPEILELPILAYRGEQWSFDVLSSEAMLKLWHRFTGGGGPRIMIGHTKAVTTEVLSNLREVLSIVKQTPMVQFESLQNVVENWWDRCRTNDYQIARQEYVRRSTISMEELWNNLAPYHQRKVDLLATYIQKFAQKQKRVRVLDVGCGTGELITLPLRYRLQNIDNVEIHGIDIDPASIARASENVSVNAIPNVSFAATPVEKVTDVFNCVICYEVIEHLENPAVFLQVLRSRLDEDGLLFLSTPNGYGYKEMERRIFYAGFDFVQRLPVWFRVKFRSLYQSVRSRVGNNLQSNRVDEKNGTRRLISGTLNFQNDIHIQWFSITGLSRFLHNAGFEIERIVNAQLLGGILGTLLEKKFDTTRFLEVMPHSLAAAWVLICRHHNAEKSSGKPS